MVKLLAKDENYYYTDVGDMVRVSRILDMQSNKVLEDWIENNKDSAEWCEYRRDLGTEVHRMIHKINIGELSFSKDDGAFYLLSHELQNSLKAWRQAKVSLKWKTYQSEFFVCDTELMVAGTIDELILESQYGIQDYKVSSGLWTRGKVQLGAYRRLLRKSYPQYEIKFGRLVRLDSETGLWNEDDQIVMNCTDLDLAEKCFLSLYDTYRYNKEEGIEKTRRI